MGEGQPTEVDVTDLVAGDVVALRVGDLVPADVRLLEVHGLECDEAILTGESMPTTKCVEASSGRRLWIFRTVPSWVRSCIRVRGGGSSCPLGRAPNSAASPPAFGETDGHGFPSRPTGFSKFLVLVAGVLTVSIFAINVGLSSTADRSLALLFGHCCRHHSRDDAGHRHGEPFGRCPRAGQAPGLVKRLVAIEDLGNIQLLFTDKTGTLTDGAISFSRSLAPDGHRIDPLLVLGLVCNEAALTTDGPVLGGNALDQALWRAPEARAVDVGGDGPTAYHRVGLLPFDHDRQLATVSVVGPDGSPILITKGAPEAVFARCTDSSFRGPRPPFRDSFEEGARVVAVATRQAPWSSHPPRTTNTI